MITEEVFNYLLAGMTVLGLIVFISLYFITAGYGQFRTKEWGLSINNKVGWVLMEAPAFLTMVIIWLTSGGSTVAPQIVLLGQVKAKCLLPSCFLV